MKRSLGITYKLAFATAFVFIMALMSCQKEVHINLGTTPSQVVVEGAIETGLPPYVILTSTMGFFSSVTQSTLEASFIHGASVQVSDGTNTIALREYSLDTGNNNKFYIYSIDTASLTNIMLGQVGKYYTLTIIYNGQTYTSATKIPTPKGIDSMWFDVPVLSDSKTPDSAKQLFVNYTDPDTTGNYVRYFTKINNQLYYPSDNFNDEVVNGTRLTKIPLNAGFARVQNAKPDSLRYFYPGDTVTLKWAEIDQGVYNFWNSFAYATNILGNPFASPINLQSNISNGGLGIWAGYGSLLYTKVVP